MIEAQHVILVEPLLDPAVEAQAIGRIHRIGQTRSTYVHRFIVEQSVEQNVARLYQERSNDPDMAAAGPSSLSKENVEAQLTVRSETLTLNYDAFVF